MLKCKIGPTALVLAMLGACDDGGSSSSNVTKITAPKENPYHQRLLKLRELDRNLALRRAVQDETGRCRGVERTAYQQDYQGMAMWTVSCSDGAWAVYVAPSGIIQARNCGHAAQLGLPQCKLTDGEALPGKTS